MASYYKHVASIVCSINCMVPAKLYPKLWGNYEPLNFLIFVGTNYCKLKPFSEMAL